MEWTAVISILLVFVLGPLALATAAMALLFVGRVVLVGRIWERLDGWCQGCAPDCGQ